MSAQRLETGLHPMAASHSPMSQIFISYARSTESTARLIAESLDARVAQDTRTLLVRGSLPNPQRQLLPGMFANVTVLVGNARPVVTVPRTAVNYSLYSDSV